MPFLWNHFKTGLLAYMTYIQKSREVYFLIKPLSGTRLKRDSSRLELQRAFIFCYPATLSHPLPFLSSQPRASGTCWRQSSRVSFPRRSPRAGVAGAGRRSLPGRCCGLRLPWAGAAPHGLGSEVAAEGGAQAGSERGGLRAERSRWWSTGKWGRAGPSVGGGPLLSRRGGRGRGAGRRWGTGRAAPPGEGRARCLGEPAAHAHGPGRVLPLPAAGLGSVRLSRARAAGDTERRRAGAWPAPSARGGLAGAGSAVPRLRRGCSGPRLGCGRGWPQGGGSCFLLLSWGRKHGLTAPRLSVRYLLCFLFCEELMCVSPLFVWLNVSAW